MSAERSPAWGVGRWPWLIVGVVLVGAALRALGLRTELWMDEILSLKLVGALETPLGVFTSIRHDNNHYLNSLWLFWVGGDAAWWQMRLPALAFGILLIPLAFRAATDWGRPAAFVGAILVALSYPLIHYSSEARGYAQLLVFAVASWLFLRNWLRTRNAGWAMAYAVSASLGFLSHLVFATVFAALLVCSVYDLLSARGGRLVNLARHGAVQALPAGTAALLYLVNVRYLEVAGGPATTAVSSWSSALGLLVGGAPGWFAVGVALAGAAAVGIELARMFREWDSDGLFFAFVILFPLANAVISPHAYQRYYLTALLFALLLCARFIARALSGSGRQRWAAAALLAAVVGLNLLQAVRFLETGRGQYLEAVAGMVAVGAADRLTVAGNHDLGQLVTIEYYEHFAPGQPTFEYLCRRPGVPGCEAFRPDPGDGAHVPAFFVAASTEDRFTPPASLDISGLAAYELMAVYPKYGLSGLYWAVYRLRDPEDPGGASGAP